MISLQFLGASPEQLREHHYRYTLYLQKPIKRQNLELRRTRRTFEGSGDASVTNGIDYVHFFEHEISTRGYQTAAEISCPKGRGRRRHTCSHVYG